MKFPQPTTKCWTCTWYISTCVAENVWSSLVSNDHGSFGRVLWIVIVWGLSSEIASKVYHKRRAIIKKSLIRYNKSIQILNQKWWGWQWKIMFVIKWVGISKRTCLVPSLQDWSIQPICATIQNTQANNPVEQILVDNEKSSWMQWIVMYKRFCAFIHRKYLYK